MKLRSFKECIKRYISSKEPRKSEQGFTLIEVMVTLTIIALMMTFVVFNVVPILGDANAKKAKADIRSIQNALEQYRLDMFDYPDQDYGLDALLSLPSGAPNESRYRTGGYISFLPNDPWEQPYIYDYPGEHGIVDIYSYGADGQPGGEGIDADIVSWEQ